MNYRELEKLLQLAKPVRMSGRKVWVLDEGNMMTAMNWYRKITGHRFVLPVPVRVADAETGAVTSTLPPGAALAAPIGALSTREDPDRKGVVVTLRGGSMSVLDAATGNKHAGPPTLEVHNAQALAGLVPTFAPFAGMKKKVIVEVKFSTLAEVKTVPIR